LPPDDFFRHQFSLPDVGSGLLGLSQVETKQKSFPKKSRNHGHNLQKPDNSRAKNPIDRAKERVSIASGGDLFSSLSGESR
jgi:hypothetical protein